MQNLSLLLISPHKKLLKVLFHLINFGFNHYVLKWSLKEKKIPYKMLFGQTSLNSKIFFY